MHSKPLSIDTAEIRRRVIQARLGGKVQRCHGVPHHGSYSNAEHQWGVMVLLWHLFPEFWDEIAPYAMTHDVPEAWVGDIPAPSGVYVPGLKESIGKLESLINEDLGHLPENGLRPEAYRVLKACDALELYIWCMEQSAQGNGYAMEIRKELEVYFRDRPLPPRGMDLVQHLCNDGILPRHSGVVRDTVKRSAAQ